MALDNDLIQEFRSKTRYNLQIYLLSVEDFSNNYFPQIVGYYTGTIKEIPQEAIKLLETLISESNRLDHIIGLNANRFETTDWWDLLELIEDVKVKLLTMDKTSKWARASITLANRTINPESFVRLTQGQTIERLAGGSLGYDDEHQDWYDIAMRNDVNEEDYTTAGGLGVNVSASGGFSFSINSIVDIIDKETLKGKDIDRKITCEDDDIKVLSGDDSFIQDVNIIMTTRKGDIPEFVSYGLSQEIAVGSNVNSISYPILIRQISEGIRRDDSIQDFSIKNVTRNQDAISLEIDVFSASREIFNLTVSI